MLPPPNSLDRRHKYGFRRSNPSWFSSANLLARSRATNLAVSVLAVVATLSFLLNVQLYYFPPTNAHSILSLPLLASLPRLQDSLDHLVVVPGHAIWVGIDPAQRMQPSEWAFQSFQTDQDTSRLEVFFQHISRAADIGLQDEKSLVVFSGGQTQHSSTTSEGESYLRLALASKVFGHDEFSRATSENYALDSFQNLVFSIARFHEVTGHYPSKITVVGYEMKRARFLDIHRTAIRWQDPFTYIGVDIPGDNSLARQGERENGYLPYAADLYGCHSFLSNKRKQRNYAARYPPYYLSNPRLASFLSWCPYEPTSIFPESLPWSTGLKTHIEQEKY
ncbi:hypothetical protein MIND_00040300 [Mycena indigotica]|uniref:DUF218 domain-containing protein n=1 Tax=Mycena indigotica TaxID=2126181 RepID=A0A8H6TDF7_9AGAR|nr:uncharacterized protein MIND_00040300 [Mycena indigotica]KAF7315259.1 hypothetical protein MIND_00040300 [Mycena indigotica]